VAGFLNQKNRIMDFSLTEIGKEKAMTGNLNYEFASFSDKSISYEYKGNILSEHVKNQNLFEISESISDNLNPNYNFNNSENVNNEETSINVDDEFFVKIDSHKILSSQHNRENIEVENKNSKNILFLNTKENEIGKYVSTVGNDININLLESITKDQRFVNKKKNLYLPPINVSNKEELYTSKKRKIKILKSNVLSQNKNNNTKNLIKELDDNSDISKFNIKILNDSYLDEFYFSIYEKEFKDDRFKNSKLIVSRIDQFIDEKTNKSVDVFIVGKVFFNKDDIDNDNEDAIDFLNHNKANLYDNYTFVNIFTMVAK